jgi:Na+-transporting NADH:ubiquinone oxidoreductase subunit NqrD
MCALLDLKDAPLLQTGQAFARHAMQLLLMMPAQTLATVRQTSSKTRRVSVNLVLRIALLVILLERALSALPHSLCKNLVAHVTLRKQMRHLLMASAHR